MKRFKITNKTMNNVQKSITRQILEIKKKSVFKVLVGSQS
jgi:hypothetical protein